MQCIAAQWSLLTMADQYWWCLAPLPPLVTDTQVTPALAILPLLPNKHALVHSAHTLAGFTSYLDPRIWIISSCGESGNIVTSPKFPFEDPFFSRHQCFSLRQNRKVALETYCENKCEICFFSFFSFRQNSKVALDTCCENKCEIWCQIAIPGLQGAWIYILGRW